MRLQDVIDDVGADRFDAACRAARDHRKDAWTADLHDVPHECADLWFVEAVPVRERLAVALEVYRRMPVYAHLLYVPGVYGSFGPAERETLWDFYRHAAGGEDAVLSEPILYSLWVDFFEDPDTVEEAWTAMLVGTQWAPRRTDRLLACSGPVPWTLKAPLLRKVATDCRRHRAVHAALVGAAFDVFGKLDRPAARELHRGLRVDPSWPGADPLATRLREPG